MKNLYQVSGIWYVSYTHPKTKKQIRHSTGTIVKEKATQLLRQEMNQAYDETNFGATTDKTIRELIDWCWDNYWCFKECADKKTRYLAMKAVLDKFGDVKATSLTPDMLREFMRERLTTCKKSTIKREFTHVSCAFYQAIKNDLLQTNPFKKIDSGLLREDDLRRTRIATPQEIELLLGHSAGMLQKIIAFDLYSGLRKGQIENLKWSDVDLRTSRMMVQTYKGGRRTVYGVPIFPQALAILKSMDQGTEYVFTNPTGGKIPEDGLIHSGFPRLVDRLRIPDLIFHDLRHTFSTAYYNQTKNLKAISMILGHRNTNTTERYLNLSHSDLIPVNNFNSYHDFITVENQASEKHVVMLDIQRLGL